MKLSITVSSSAVPFVVLSFACGDGQKAGNDAHPIVDAIDVADGPGGNVPEGGAPGQDAEAPDGGEPELYRSGTRIKMRMLTTPDGAKVFQSMYDNERQEDCSFQIASDGTARCLPSIALVHPSIFEDAQCTVSVALVPSCSPPPRYVAAGRSADCPFTQGPIFRAVEAANTFFVKSGANCVASGPISGNTPYRASGPEIPPTSFQAATVSIE